MEENYFTVVSHIIIALSVFYNYKTNRFCITTDLILKLKYLTITVSRCTLSLYLNKQYYCPWSVAARLPAVWCARTCFRQRLYWYLSVSSVYLVPGTYEYVIVAPDHESEDTIYHQRGWPGWVSSPLIQHDSSTLQRRTSKCNFKRQRRRFVRKQQTVMNTLHLITLVVEHNIFTSAWPRDRGSRRF